MNDTNNLKKKSKTFKHTRELVRLAINDGMTQDEIKNLCRAGSQSMVSDWRKGKRLAPVHIMQPLIERYGHRLRRKSFKVYWEHRDDEEMESEHRFYKIEGRVIMDHKFHDLRRCVKTGKLKKSFAARRLIVHDQGRGQYLLLLLKRLQFTKSDELLECNSEGGAWATNIVEPGKMDKDELIALIDSEKSMLLENVKLLSDATTLPYLIRCALLYAGEEIDEVEVYPSNV